MMHAQIRHPRGFSLIELLMVIALISIVAGVVLPQFQPTIHDQLLGVSEIISADLAYARNLAVTNNSTYRVDFDLANDRYVISHSGANMLLDTLPSWAFRDPSDPPDQQITVLSELPRMGAEVEIYSVRKVAGSSQEVSDLEFGPLGETTRVEETVIWLACGVSTARRYLSLTVNPVTGIVARGEFSEKSPPGILAKKVL